MSLQEKRWRLLVEANRSCAFHACEWRRRRRRIDTLSLGICWAPLVDGCCCAVACANATVTKRLLVSIIISSSSIAESCLACPYSCTHLVTMALVIGDDTLEAATASAPAACIAYTDWNDKMSSFPSLALSLPLCWLLLTMTMCMMWPA